MREEIALFALGTPASFPCASDPIPCASRLSSDPALASPPIPRARAQPSRVRLLCCVPSRAPPPVSRPQGPNPPARRNRRRRGGRGREMEMSADDLRLDLEELQRLEGLAKRPRVLSLLANEIRSVDAKVGKATAPASAPQAVAAASAPAAAAAAAPAGVSYVTLGSFSWDQDNEKIRRFATRTTCAIPKLNKEIVPEKSKVVVKPTKIVITLYKASKSQAWIKRRIQCQELWI